ncbi:hypothetical protein M405DRAFT_315496 [Rhizopogon salebrosus TDB-379]|nr:hypothetical protein M405DRAFT_315496 [Rhizopogon salebrosus TDB-379]
MVLASRSSLTPCRWTPTEVFVGDTGLMHWEFWCHCGVYYSGNLCSHLVAPELFHWVPVLSAISINWRSGALVLAYSMIHAMLVGFVVTLFLGGGRWY